VIKSLMISAGLRYVHTIQRRTT